jgi:cytochrome c oxidase cbb3-type subunit 3
MKNFIYAVWSVAALLLLAEAGAGQQHQPTPAPHEQPAEDPAAVQRGQALFRSTCGFCHGEDATGARAPDLVRSVIVSHDNQGDLVGPVIRNGRPDMGMPSFVKLSDDQVRDIVAFLHHQAYEALQSGHVSGDYPAAKLLTGNAEAGKQFFYSAGNCSHCHSVTGDLAGIATKLKPIDLQQHMIYPSRKEIPKTATVTLANGKRYEGKLAHKDEFEIAIVCQDGWYRSWPLNEVKTEIHDPLAAHRELTSKYTDRDIHNLFAYLETLK